MWSARTLLIADPNLGDAARTRLAAVCNDLTCLVWDVTHPHGRDRILARIGEARWPLAISFYSDLILPPAELAVIDLPLNIHPALPHVGGVGHDVVPLVERHATVGATLHRMEPTVDTGAIYDVCEAPVPPGSTYPSLRALNQANSLRLLDRVCAAMSVSDNLAQLRDKLTDTAGVPHRWGHYYSRRAVARLREEHATELGIDIVVQGA